jgi:hypothetical protein
MDKGTATQRTAARTRIFELGAANQQVGSYFETNQHRSLEQI